MFKQIVTPQSTQLILQLPANFVGHEVEVIAFTTDDAQPQTEMRKKYSFEEFKKFAEKHAVPFPEKTWTREDLYDDKRNGGEGE